MGTGGMRRTLTRIAVAIAVAVTLAACAAEESAEAGFGVAQQEVVGQFGGTREAIRGTVSIGSNGCLRLALDDGTSPWIVWPPGSSVADNGGVIADGARYYDGDEIIAAGVLGELSDLDGGDNPDAYFGAFGGYCGAAETGVVVFDAVSHAES